MEDRADPKRYEILVGGFMSDRSLSGFPELHAQLRNHETLLTGAVPDQAALHGVIGRIESLGLELIEIRLVRSGRNAPADADHPNDGIPASSAESNGDASSDVHRGYSQQPAGARRWRRGVAEHEPHRRSDHHG